MKRFLAIAVAVFFAMQSFAVQSLSAQFIPRDESRIFTFDKLSKTIIPLDAASQPSVKVEPAVPGFSVQATNGKYAIVVDKPVSAGQYAVSITSGGITQNVEWRVLPTSLEAKSMRSLAGTKFYFGKRISLRNRLPAEAELPLQQFKIDYQIGNDKPVTDNSYSEFWIGPNIPASARTVKFSIVWVYPQTGERVALFAREATPEQTPPEISCATALAEFNRYDAKTNTYFVDVKGISVDHEVPIDADNTDISISKSLRATLSNVEGEPVTIDYNAAETALRPYNNGEADVRSRWLLSAATVSIVNSAYDSSTGIFPVTLAIKGIEPSSTELRGAIALQTKAKIVNRKAGVSASSFSPPCVVAINLPVNRHLNKTKREELMEQVAATYAPTTEKSVRLSGEEFLRRQSWLAERIKKMSFSVITANEAITSAVRTLVNPLPQRTPALEIAEQECTNTDDIKKRIMKGQPVPQTLIEEGGSVRDCERVQEYYRQVAAHKRIQHIAMLIERKKDGSLGEVLGALALEKAGNNDLLITDRTLASPLKIWSADELKALQLHNGSLYDSLQQQITDVGKGIIERNVSLETTEFVPLAKSKSPAPKKK